MNIFTKKDGAVTIFLSIIIAVCMLLSQFLVEAARSRAAIAQVESALDMSALSTLTNYSEVLNKMYGLIALSEDDSEKLRDELEYYLVRTLNVKGLEDPSVGFENILTLLDGAFEDKKPKYKSMFDFRVENLKIDPIYNISEPEIMRAQILEYMKYRAPKELAEGALEKFTAFGSLSTQAKKLEKKIEIDEKMDKVRKKQEEASNDTYVANSFGLAFDFDSAYEDVINEILSKCSVEIIIENKEEKIDKLNKEKKKLIIQKNNLDSEKDKDAIKDINKKIKNIEGKIDEIKKEINDLEDSIEEINEGLKQSYTNLEEYINWAKDSINNATKNLKSVIQDGKDIGSQIENLKNDFKGDQSDFSASIKLDLENKEKIIQEENLKQHISDLESNKKVLDEILNIMSKEKFHEIGIKKFDKSFPNNKQVRSLLKVTDIKNSILKYKGYINMKDGNTDNKPIEFFIPTEVEVKQKEDSDPRDIVIDRNEEKPTGIGNISQIKNTLSSSLNIKTDPNMYDS